MLHVKKKGGGAGRFNVCWHIGHPCGTESFCVSKVNDFGRLDAGFFRAQYFSAIMVAKADSFIRKLMVAIVILSAIKPLVK